MSVRYLIPKGGRYVSVTADEFARHQAEKAQAVVDLAQTSRAQDVSFPFANTKPLVEPSIIELGSNFAGAVSRWAEAGFPTVKAEVYAARSSACDVCEFWNAKARFGLGKCGAPGCGCTSLKRWIATERCPLAKW